jgi:hypothetical protein
VELLATGAWGITLERPLAAPQNSSSRNGLQGENELNSPALGEFLRVLKPGGRLALVNLSKRVAGRRTLYERFYEALPRRWVPYVAGGCRPVVMAGAVERTGFRDLRYRFVSGLLPAEVLIARKPTSPG